MLIFDLDESNFAVQSVSLSSGSTAEVVDVMMMNLNEDTNGSCIK